MSSLSSGPMAGIFVLSFGLMLYELSLTRVLSVLYYYHTAFLAISVAMLGLGVGGAAVHVFPAFCQRRRIAILALCALAMGALPPLFESLRPELQELESSWTAGFLIPLAITCLVILIPFLCGGAVIALTFQNHSQVISRLYALDLVGAACAALCLVPVMNLAGGPTALFVSGAVTSLALFILYQARGLATALFSFLMLLAALQNQIGLFPLRVDLGEGEREARILHERWNAFSRVVAVEHVGWDRGLSELRLQAVQDTIPRQIDALIDINAYAPMLEFHGDLQRVAYLEDIVSNLVYRLLPPGSHVAILGPGGGKDVLGALLFEPASVTGIELNEIIARDFACGEYAEFVGNIYSQKGVSLIVGDGRSELVKSEKKFDVIVANSVATWAAHSSGAMNLTESGLFTVEAFARYRAALDEDGMLSVSLWDENQHSLPLRLIETWRQVEGARIGERVAVIGNRWQEGLWFSTVILARRPFTADQVRVLSDVAYELDFDVIYLPGQGEQAFARYLESPEMFVAKSRFDISAATDNRPFFFYTLRPGDALRFWRTRVAATDNAAWASLITSLGVLGCFVLLLYGPLLLRMSRAQSRMDWRESVYFSSVGLGFMFVEIALVQRLSLFLGHPTYALTVGLAGLLFWTGCGSLLTGRRSQSGGFERWFQNALLALVILVSGNFLLLPTAAGGMALRSDAFRIAIAFLAIAPTGLLLGIPMAGSLCLLGPARSNLIAWAWSLNGAFGVLASVASIVVSILWGIHAAFTAGIFFYLVAWLAWSMRPKRPFS